MAKDPTPPEVDEKVAPNLYAKTDLLKAMSEYFVDALPQVGYKEDQFWTDVRILLCVISVAFGCTAQFALKFPDDKVLIAACVAAYFAFSGIVALLDYFIKGTSVTCLKLGGQSVFLDITMVAFSPDVTLALRTRGKKVENKGSVARYFDSNGVLRQESLFSDFLKLVKDWEKTPAAGKNKKE